MDPITALRLLMQEISMKALAIDAELETFQSGAQLERLVAAQQKLGELIVCIDIPELEATK